MNNANLAAANDTNTTAFAYASPSASEAEALAAAMLAAEQEAERAAERAKALRKALQEKMAAEGRTTVDVPGVGIVKTVAGGTRTTVDPKAAEAKIAELSAMLTAHGVEHDAPLTIKIATLAPSLRITWAK